MVEAIETVAPKSASKKDARRSLIALADQGVMSAANFVLLLAVARFTSAVETGAFVLALRTVDIFTELYNVLIWAPFTLFAPGCETGERRRYRGSVLVHQIGMTLLTMAGAVLVIAVLFSTRVSESAGFALAAVLAGGSMLLREFARRMAFSALRVEHALAIDSAVFVLQAAGVIFLWARHAFSSTSALCVAGVACLVVAVAYLGLTRKNFEVERSSIRSHLGRNLRYGRWLFGSDFALLLSNQIYPWLIAAVAGKAAVAVFAASQAITNFARMFLISAQNVLLPKAAQAWVNGGSGELRRMVRQSTLALSGGAALFCVAMLFGSRPLVELIYGDRFPQAANVVFLLSLTILAMAVTLPSTIALSASRRADLNVVANVLALLVHVTAGLLLTGRFGAVGAAYGLMLGSGVAALVRLHFYRRIFGGYQ
jgi:O-antigen/teichoic acid export membrane protein